jgi:creatinine amidohydrolase
MRLEDLNWMDVKEYLQKDDRLILVLGSTEQHGYLSLTTDVKIPLALADAASRKTGVLLAPPLNFGVAPYFLDYPGTISLRVTSLLSIVEDIIRSVFRQGFRRVLVMNGHGGNTPVQVFLQELANDLPGLRLNWYAWWQSHSVEDFTIKHALKPYHAGWLEAFPFCRVSELPPGEKAPAAYKGLPDAHEARRIFGDGVFGGFYQVAPEIMDELFGVCLEDILYLLEFSGD